MFDTIRNQFKPLGEDLYDFVFQTKDLECLMLYYYINPDGQLYTTDYSGTQDFYIELNDNLIPNFKWKWNGVRGRVTPLLISDYVLVSYRPHQSERNLYIRLHFLKGAINSWERVNDESLYYGKHSSYRY